jgi:hypothetical protein
MWFGSRLDRETSGFKLTTFSTQHSSQVISTIREIPDADGGDPDGVFTPGEVVYFYLESIGREQSFKFFGTVEGNPVVEDGIGTLFILNDDLPAGSYNVNTVFILPVCFLPGTLIATPAGEIAVEALAIGDPILTADGRTIPVRWIGRQTIVTAFGPPANSLPVLVEAGALSPGLPRRDLRVTSDHALILDGIAVQAGALVNGTTIRRIPRAELGARLTVFHVETDGHEVILAEGAATETFVDSTTRSHFDNAAEHVALYGDVPIEEMPLPRAMSHRQVPAALRARIAARAAELMRGRQAA